MHCRTCRFGWMGLDLTLFRDADDPVPTGRLTYGRLRQATVHLATLKGAVAARLIGGRLPLPGGPGIHDHRSLTALVSARAQAVVSTHDLAFPTGPNPEFETFYRLDAALRVLEDLCPVSRILSKTADFLQKLTPTDILQNSCVSTRPQTSTGITSCSRIS